jgi:hypothetical protein
VKKEVEKVWMKLKMGKREEKIKLNSNILCCLPAQKLASP